MEEGAKGLQKIPGNESESYAVLTLVSPHKHVLPSKPPGKLVLGGIRVVWQVLRSRRWPTPELD